MKTNALRTAKEYLVIGFTAATLAACGGGGGDGGNSSQPPATRLIGGSIQGKALNLTGSVTTPIGTARGTDGTGAAARFYAPYGVTTDGTDLFVADQGDYVIRKVTVATGTVTTLAISSVIGPGALTSDGTNLYVIDAYSVARQIVIATGVVTTIAGAIGNYGSGDGVGAAAQFKSPVSIATDGESLFVADSANCTIRRIVIATQEVTTIAGSADSCDTLDGVGSAARFKYPTGVALVGSNLYVADQGSFTIRKIELASAIVSTIAGQSGVAGWDDGIGTAAHFFGSFGLSTDGTDLFLIDAGGHTLRRIDPTTGAVSTIAGNPNSSSWYEYVDGIGSQARFLSARELAVMRGKVYVSDQYGDAIRAIDLSTAAVSTLVGTPPGRDATGPSATFGRTAGIATDGHHLYIADASQHTVRQADIATSEVSTVAGSPFASGHADGVGALARFEYPQGITTDGTNIYVADVSTIRKIALANGSVTTLAGTYGVSGVTDGTGPDAQFSDASGITTDGANLYVTDQQNCSIRVIVAATGVVTTLAGTANSCGAADGIGAAAQFGLPTAIATDGTYLYVTDVMNCSIRRVEIATREVATFAGSAHSCGYADGTGGGARFFNPFAITSDGTNLFVSDGHVLRKIVIATRVVTTIAGVYGQHGSADGVGASAQFQFPRGITTDGNSLYISDAMNDTIRRVE